MPLAASASYEVLEYLVSSTDYFDAFGDGGLASAKPNLCALPL